MKKSEEDCIFCRIARKEIKNEFVCESDNFFAIKDIHPVSDGHTLIIPKMHYVTLIDISNNLGNEMVEIMKKVASLIIDKKYGEGFNILMNNFQSAGQIVKHAHIHVIPRKEKDNLKMPI